MSDIKLKFEAAVEVIKNLPKNQTYQPSNELMLRFYSLYKQVVFGKCNIPRPGFWDVVGRAKWDAWNNIGNMSPNQAMTLYVEELKKVIETMPHSADVGNFLQTLGSFYEVVNINSEGNDNELNVYQQIDLKVPNSCESSISDKCSENSFYEVAPTFFGDFDAMETIKRLQDDIEILNARVKALESNHTKTNHCICRMFIRIPQSQYKIPIFLVAGLSIALSPILWIIITRILRILRHRRHLKISNI